MNKNLIIGTSGTLGREFAKLLPHAIMVSGETELDVTNHDAVAIFLQTHRPNIIFNCTAYTNVDGAETNFDTALLLNRDAPANLAQEAAKIGARLVHFSTGMVFRGNDENGCSENTPTSPVNKYGESKLAGEQAVLSASPDHFVIRTEWLYGKPMSATAKKSFVEIMLEAGKSGKVKAVTDEIGQPTWARDLATASLELVESNPGGIYHLANEGQASRYDWAAEIYRIGGMPVEIEPVPGSTFPRAAKRPEYELLINTKTTKLRDWREALREYLTT